MGLFFGTEAPIDAVKMAFKDFTYNPGTRESAFRDRLLN
jgi:hypothetical protein